MASQFCLCLIYILKQLSYDLSKLHVALRLHIWRSLEVWTIGSLQKSTFLYHFYPAWMFYKWNCLPDTNSIHVTLLYRYWNAIKVVNSYQEFFIGWVVHLYIYIENSLGFSYCDFVFVLYIYIENSIGSSYCGFIFVGNDCWLIPRNIPCYLRNHLPMFHNKEKGDLVLIFLLDGITV